jgi:hypothetical protein
MCPGQGHQTGGQLGILEVSCQQRVHFAPNQTREAVIHMAAIADSRSSEDPGYLFLSHRRPGSAEVPKLALLIRQGFAPLRHTFAEMREEPVFGFRVQHQRKAMFVKFFEICGHIAGAPLDIDHPGQPRLGHGVCHLTDCEGPWVNRDGGGAAHACRVCLSNPIRGALGVLWSIPPGAVGPANHTRRMRNKSSPAHIFSRESLRVK